MRANCAIADISIPRYERIGAPRVGYDTTANAWITERQNAQSPEDVAAVLKEFHGYYVLRLVQCDGVPKYSNGGLYDGADETSFRGAFLNDCQDMLGEDLFNDAWNSKLPATAVSYGQPLLAAAVHRTAFGEVSCECKSGNLLPVPPQGESVS